MKTASSPHPLPKLNFNPPFPNPGAGVETLVGHDMKTKLGDKQLPSEHEKIRHTRALLDRLQRTAIKRWSMSSLAAVI